LVVFDITGASKNVFFELGFTLGLGIEFLLVYDKTIVTDFDKQIPFYAKQYGCLGYSGTDELREVVQRSIEARGIIGRGNI